MRLLKLKIKNIASLKGEHVINFAAIQEQSSLFAITGETGSGKSSILNAIGLALYGQIYKKNVTQVDVVTLGEKEGEITLLFQVAGKNYLAEWQARVRKQNGELLKQPMMQRQVYPIDGEDFVSFRREPIESVERLLNLDFDQFCKCIILNQGEFARFLGSTFTERKEILEKLYPGEHLDQLGQELKEQLTILENDKSELDIKLGELKGESVDGENLTITSERLKKNLELYEGWLKKVESLEYHFVALSGHYTKYHENKKRSDLIKSDIALAMSSYNLILKESAIINEAHQGLKTKLAVERPKLLELLKTEEALKHNQNSYATLTKKTQDTEHELGQLLINIGESESKIKNREDEIKGLINSFTYSIADLKTNRGRLDHIFDLFNIISDLLKEQRGIEERLRELETQGKEVNQQVSLVIQKLGNLPSDLKDKLLEAEKKRSELSKIIEQRQHLTFQSLEHKKRLEQIEADLFQLNEKISGSKAALTVYEQEQNALETSLKVQELTSAIELCLTHAASTTSPSCPVCTTSVNSKRWMELLQNLNRADEGQIKTRSLELSRLIIGLQEEIKLGNKQKNTLEDNYKIASHEFKVIQEDMKAPLPSLQELEGEIKLLQTRDWEFENLKLEETRLNTELLRAREQFGKVRGRHQEIHQVHTLREKELEALCLESNGFLSYPLTLTIIESLKTDSRLLSQYLTEESAGEKLKHELSFRQNNQAKLVLEKESTLKEATALFCTIQDQKKKLQAVLGAKSAQELLENLDQEMKVLTEKWAKSEKDLRLQELNLKEHQSKLYNVDDQLKEYDLLFAKALNEIRSVARVELPPIKEELSGPISKLNELSLDFSSPIELFVPINEFLAKEKDILKNDANRLRMEYASILQRLQDWEKRQDRIRLFELQKNEIDLKWQRRQRLFEVLGKDELRSFVLSLVEENLILQTNEELQKLCQGRYEIIHQARGMRMTPEFYILDKFREGGRRKVSTLSGGETFMVSLAMALALAEMTRGQAEIDSLFIDEGFGTLDQDSLEDVLDMLNQIQTRGLLVGIISHIKTLTNAIPINLVLNKKMDGTSSIDFQVN